MSFFEAVASCFSKYAQFKGRSSRAEFWWFFLFLILSITLLNQLVMSFFGQQVAAIISLIYFLVILLPLISVKARRLHDMNHSGWWLLLSLITGIGSLILLVWLMFAGTPGANRFGESVVALED